MKKTMDVGDYDVMVLKAELGTVLDELVENLEKYVCAVRVDVGMGVASFPVSPVFWRILCKRKKKWGDSLDLHDDVLCVVLCVVFVR